MITQPLQSNDKTKQSSLTPLKLDLDDYRKDLAKFELTKAQENELLQALWYIMSSFVDIGWGVDIIQLFLPDLFEKAGADSDKLLQQTETKTGNNTAKIKAVGKDEHHD